MQFKSIKNIKLFDLFLGILSFLFLSMFGIGYMIKGYPFYDPSVQAGFIIPIVFFIFFISFSLTNLIVQVLPSSKKWLLVLRYLIFITSLGLNLLGYAKLMHYLNEKNRYYIDTKWDETTNLWKRTHYKRGALFKISYSQYPKNLPVAPLLPPKVSMGPNGYVLNNSLQE